MEAVESLRAAVRCAPDNADVLTFTAQVLAASDQASVRNGQSAFALAAKANVLTGGGRPQTLDVLGMACAEMGRFDEAKMAAETALEVAAALKLKNTEPIRQRLELYQNRRPWRESFRATNAPAKY
jgi:cytochrome c-type biogenesis protein CcmH/NrfG